MRDLSGRQLDDGPHAANQGPTPEQLQQRQARSLASLEAGMAYSPEPLPIPVHFFAAQGNDLNFALSWSAVVPESRLRVIPVPGTHNRMMSKPNVATVGHALSHALQNASAKPNEMPEQGYFPLVKLQSGQRNLAPLFCVPGAGANVSCFLELAACLEEAQPVYGLQPRGLDGAMVPHATVAAACEFYLRAIVETCPKGPVHLLGHSFGGWVVFAMAQRLRQAGRVIASLTILDSEIPDEEGAAIREYNNVEAILVWIDIFEKILEHPLGVSRGDIEPRDEAAQRKLLHDRLVSEGLMPRQSDPDRLRGPLQTFARSLRTHYTPSEIYPGPVRLVLVNDQKLDQDANRRNREQVAEGWKRWAPNLVCTCAPGNHLTILNQPHVHVLAGLVREAISDIGREGASKVVMTGD
jgi:arthrofactin-type cyclic lipopeptide synthetase C